MKEKERKKEGRREGKGRRLTLSEKVFDCHGGQKLKGKVALLPIYGMSI